jgi:hypothetical protein
MGAKIGNLAKLYRSESAALLEADTAEEAAGHDWTEVTNVRDVTSGGETGTADVSTRGTIFRKRVPTMSDADLEMEMLVDIDSTDFTIFRNAWASREPIALAAMSGDIDDTGEFGFVGNYLITNFRLPQPLEGAQTVEVTASAHEFIQLYIVEGSA